MRRDIFLNDKKSCHERYTVSERDKQYLVKDNRERVCVVCKNTEDKVIESV